MVHTDDKDFLFAYRCKRDKMIKAEENGMTEAQIVKIFGLTIGQVINLIVELENRTMVDDITNYSTESLKEQKAFQEAMADQNPVVIFTTNEIIQELKRRAEDIVNNKIRFTEDYGETTPAICAATSF